jgi:hypothetical protein
MFHLLIIKGCDKYYLEKFDWFLKFDKHIKIPKF